MMPAELLSPAQMAWPTDWQELFNSEGPILLEIGFGNGQFLADLASKKPNSNVVGIEISSPSIKKTQTLLRDRGISNVQIVRAPGQLALWTLFEVSSIQGIFVNFPDPWPKEKHHKRRLINNPFLSLLASRMASGGYLDVATDHVDYASWIRDHLEACDLFESRLDQSFTQVDPSRKPTKYERKALNEDARCYYFKWRRNDKPYLDSYPIPAEYAMPHVVIDLNLSIDDIVDGFSQIERSEGELSVRITDLYKSTTNRRLLCDTFINEQPLAQRVMIAISKRDRGDFIVQLHGAGHPRSSAGVQLAMQSLAEEIVKLDPNSSIVRHNLGDWQTNNLEEN